MSKHVTLTHYTLNKYFLQSLQRKPVAASKTSPILFFLRYCLTLFCPLVVICRINSTLFQEEPLQAWGTWGRKETDRTEQLHFFKNFKIEPFYVQNNGPNCNTPGFRMQKTFCRQKNYRQNNFNCSGKIIKDFTQDRSF